MSEDDKYVLKYIPEPTLTFGYGQKLTDPRDGLTLFGPFTQHNISGTTAIGIIGSCMSRQRMKRYLVSLQQPVNSADDDVARPPFPGLQAAYGIQIDPNRIVEIDVPTTEVDNYLNFTDAHQRVHNLCNSYASRLADYLRKEEVPVSIWFVAIPDTIYAYCRPQSRIPSGDTNIRTGLSKKDQHNTQAFLFAEMELLREAYTYEVNFHNQLKAKLLSNRIVTQIILDSTIGYEELWDNETRIAAERKFDSAKAWNISNTMYYKLGGLPWKLGEVRPRVCYLGLVYKKLIATESDLQACCAAQMFLDSGDGLVFRGNIGPWYNPDTKEYHLKKADAAKLLLTSLESFRERSSDHIYPDEVFIHARTFFGDEEWDGFLGAADGKTRLVGVRIRDDSGCKLYRNYSYAVPRGTVLITKDGPTYLWSKGFVPRLQTQMGLETPNPIRVDVCRGEADIMVVCKDLLSLTKLNYNSCIFADGLPVTLRFADRIGEVLTAGKDVDCGVLTFKHYI